MTAHSRPTLRAHLTADRATAERLADALSEQADFAVAISETAGTCSVDIHLAEARAEEAVRDLVRAVAGPAIARAMSFETVAERDWVAASLAGLAPVQAGRFVVHGAHDRARVASNRIGIEIEAALAFGTGHHGTTRGCLIALDAIARSRRPRRVLDIGTGTGVLAIAAAKALRARVLASDIDGVSIRVARDNARLNRMPRIEFIRARGTCARSIVEGAPYDLVFANILLLPVMRLASPVAHLVARDARVVLSGLLSAHANAALSAWRTQSFHCERRILLDGWATLILRRSRA